MKWPTLIVLYIHDVAKNKNKVFLEMEKNAPHIIATWSRMEVGGSGWGESALPVASWCCWLWWGWWQHWCCWTQFTTNHFCVMQTLFIWHCTRAWVWRRDYCGTILFHCCLGSKLNAGQTQYVFLRIGLLKFCSTEGHYCGLIVLDWAVTFSHLISHCASWLLNKMLTFPLELQ